ncbi:LacI family DNA-binding transcriptional regulator [Nocardia concava]|uniref:LacI family DNA-binding transcriptional regulator n=1 Tax=Nocardia concava TaxID=257281 RepID=UPI0002E7F822|nr:LacI family DNA-binding transcriptional regulator [Nocardia concava]
MVKIAEVAQRAGVSPSTVSYVLSGKRAISAATRQRVQEAIAELGYRPHAGARALAGKRSNILALMIPLRANVGVPVVMQFAVAAATAARHHDYDLLLLTQEEGEQGLRRVMNGSIADGLIVMDVELRDARLPLLRTIGLPSVLIGFPADPEGLTCIDLDFRAAGAACAEHLASLGHRNIAMVGSPPEVYARETAFAPRVSEGFQAAARAHGMTATVSACAPTVEAARRLVDQLLAEQPGLTGLVVHNEPILEPLMVAFAARGRQVPGDLSVVALCPDDIAEHPVVPVTNITIPAAEVGERAVDLLVGLLVGEPVAPSTLLPPTLTVRASTARAPG